MADVLIAGGGIAGASLAVMLGRAGVRVELFERGSFPREKPCGEGLFPGGVRVMERLGLKVARLIRTSYGPFQLGQLAEGQTEEIPARLWREKLGIGRKKRADPD